MPTRKHVTLSGGTKKEEQRRFVQSGRASLRPFLSSGRVVETNRPIFLNRLAFWHFSFPLKKFRAANLRPPTCALPALQIFKFKFNWEGVIALTPAATIGVRTTNRPRRPTRTAIAEHARDGTGGLLTAPSVC